MKETDSGTKFHFIEPISYKTVCKYRVYCLRQNTIYDYITTYSLLFSSNKFIGKDLIHLVKVTQCVYCGNYYKLLLFLTELQKGEFKYALKTCGVREMAYNYNFHYSLKTKGSAMVILN